MTGMLKTTMNTQISTLTAPAITCLPQVSVSLPQFASKEEYLAFVSAWKEVYRYLSLERRIAKLRSKVQFMPAGVKCTSLENMLAMMEENLKKFDPSISAYVSSQSTWKSAWPITPENTGNERTKARTLYGSDALATWLIFLRRESKKLAGIRMAQAKLNS